jgi:predicted membrane protein
MRNSDGRLVIGVILVAVGIFLLLNNIIHFHFFILDYIFTFPVLMMAIGFVLVINSRDNFFGYLLILGGAYFFAKDVLDLEVDYIVSDLWPLLVIAFGLYLLLKRKSRMSHKHNAGWGAGESGVNDFEQNKMDYIDEATILGSSNKSFSSQQFRGGKITSIFGGSEIDLRNCKLSSGRQIIDILTIFGGTTIFLPSDWKVVISVTAIFGGFDDDRFIAPDAEVDQDKILVIKGTVLFGGGEIKS